MNKEEKDPYLTHLKGLLEMYLSSQLLAKEIVAPLRDFLSESEINKELSSKTGKVLNSIYRDKNTGVSFNAAMFLRYWKALLEIFEEKAKDKDKLPSLNDLVAKYKEVINAISQIEGEISFDSAVNNHVQLLGELVAFFEKQPFSGRNEKKNVLNILKKRTDIQQALIQQRKERMNKVD